MAAFNVQAVVAGVAAAPQVAQAWAAAGMTAAGQPELLVLRLANGGLVEATVTILHGTDHLSPRHALGDLVITIAAGATAQITGLESARFEQPAGGISMTGDAAAIAGVTAEVYRLPREAGL